MSTSLLKITGNGSFLFKEAALKCVQGQSLSSPELKLRKTWTLVSLSFEMLGRLSGSLALAFQESLVVITESNSDLNLRKVPEFTNLQAQGPKLNG